jgi:predicted GNAT family acetyltransferase
VAGCCALRPIDNVDYANAAEMKRLYVRKAFRGFGLGRQLAEAILDAARAAGYHSVLLDTLDEMEAARQLYASKRLRPTTTTLCKGRTTSRSTCDGHQATQSQKTVGPFKGSRREDTPRPIAAP